jgi:hypothetical protein
MNHSAHPPGALEGGTVSPGVQAGSRFQFAENTGTNSADSSTGQSNRFLLGGLGVRVPLGGLINDCGGVSRGHGGVRGSVASAGAQSLSQKATTRPIIPGAQSPLSTLIAVLTVPALAVAVGLVWSQL